MEMKDALERVYWPMVKPPNTVFPVVLLAYDEET